jgi:hypothetical protein
MSRIGVPFHLKKPHQIASADPARVEVLDDQDDWLATYLWVPIPLRLKGPDGASPSQMKAGNSILSRAATPPTPRRWANGFLLAMACMGKAFAPYPDFEGVAHP